MNSAQAQLYLETNSDFTPENGWLGFDEVFPFSGPKRLCFAGAFHGSRREWYEKTPNTKKNADALRPRRGCNRMKRQKVGRR